MRLLYTLFVYLYGLAIRLAVLNSHKAKQWVRGRKNWKNTLSNFNPSAKPVAWFHTASLGEFEQGRPVIESFRNSFPGYHILLTFFSPSGYEIRKNYDCADTIIYLPADLPQNVHFFLNTVKPGITFFIKYEYWFNYMNELKQRNIPLYVISAIFRPSQHFFKPWGSWFRNQLNAVNYFFVQNKESMELLHSINLQNTMISGDTRFDRVADIVHSQELFPLVEKFTEGNQIILAGSSWFPDEKNLSAVFTQFPQNVKLILAPHEVNEKRIQEIESLFPQHTVRLSIADFSSISSYKVLIIDGIGFLSKLYRYAQIAYIGGGFGKGIHNILEAAVYGVPIIIGPNYSKFMEARDLIYLKGAFPIQNADDLCRICIELLGNESIYQHSSQVCSQYVKEHKGATEKIIRYISQQPYQ